MSPYRKSVLAEGMAQLGGLAGALDLADEVIAQVGRPGWEERCHYAEILGIKGGLLALKGGPAGAQRAYDASFDWARQQQAKSCELRTATSYARPMRDQGKRAEARDLLAPACGWFTEGFATKDLKDARALRTSSKPPMRSLQRRPARVPIKKGRHPPLCNECPRARLPLFRHKTGDALDETARRIDCFARIFGEMCAAWPVS
jgi:hypothetical protein